MKKIVKYLLITMLWLMCFCLSFSASAEVSTTVDYKTGNVTVMGTAAAQSDISVKVTKMSDCAFINQVKSDYQGKYQFTFNVDDVFGIYNVKINDGTGVMKNEEVYFDIFVPEFSAIAKTSGKSVDFIEDLGNEDLVIKLSLDHNPTYSSFEKVDTKLLCAAYDEDMILIDTKQSENILSENTDETNSFTRIVEFSNQTAKKAKYIRAFLWNNGNMMPYTGVWEIDQKPFQDSIKVLAIGNSHCENSTKFTYEFAKQLGIEDVVIGYTYSGGATLETLYNHVALNYDIPYYKKKNGEWSRYTDMTIVEAIKDEEWDFVFIQEGVEFVGLPAVDNSKYDSSLSAYNEEHLEYLVDTIKTYCPNSNVQAGWHATFAFSDVDKMSDAFPTCKQRLVDWYDGSSDTMFLKSAEAVREKIVTNNNFAKIIWTSTAIQNSANNEEIASASTYKNLHAGDGIHIDDVGGVVASLAWLKGLGYNIDKLTRITEPVEASVQSMNADQVIDRDYIDVSYITDRQFELMKKAVNAAYNNPYEITEIE